MSFIRYAPIVALAGLLNGPFSPVVATQRSMYWAVLPVSSPG